MRSPYLLASSLGGAVLAAVLTVPPTPAHAQTVQFARPGGSQHTHKGAGAALAVPPAEHKCLDPNGNLNELYRISERIIGPPACREALAGEPWVWVAPAWITAASADGAVYPAGYTPAKPKPIDDFNSKFVGARYVHDRGTAQERTFTFGREALRTGFFTGEVGGQAGQPGLLDGLPFPSSGPVSPPFRPLSVGQHTTTVFVRLSAEHCSGLGTNRAQNCLPEGEFQWTGDTPFRVFP